MRIGWVGGVERSEPQLERLANAAGHTLDFHGGHLAGRGSPALYALVERSELVLIVTEVNSHGAVQLARKLCKQLGRPCMVVRNLGPARFGQLLSSLAVRETRLAG